MEECKPKDERVSRCMRANKPENTGPEMAVRRMLWKNGLKGYRLHNKKLPGRPDISFPRHKVAVFVNGCFWHDCPKCKRSVTKHNSQFWKAKFERNKARDQRNYQKLSEGGWQVVVLWECDVKRYSEAELVGKVDSAINQK